MKKRIFYAALLCSTLLFAQERDPKLAPNSFIFDVAAKGQGGLYIPVEKAYAMWETGPHMGGEKLPEGTVTAEVLWEDEPGLIRSEKEYRLEITGSGRTAKIKVPVNRSKKGNAVIVYKVNGEVYWSWHVWVTDDPTHGSTYKHNTKLLQRQLPDGSSELIPDAEWGWMDRNLGALSGSLTQGKWSRNGGLLYQWGRKDPFPALVGKGDDFYEVSGSIGIIRHDNSRNKIESGKTLKDLQKRVAVGDAKVQNNLRLSVQNPLGIVYVVNADGSRAYYNKNANLPYNWFGTDPALASNRQNKLGELNLWSDNSQGKYKVNEQAAPYRPKSAYDPCPNGWRVPSALTAALSSKQWEYLDDIKVSNMPFGLKNDAISRNSFGLNNLEGSALITPNKNAERPLMDGMQVYPGLGADLTNVGGVDMGVFPGTGAIVRSHGAGADMQMYTDQHHVELWTATMVRFGEGSGNTTPAVGARRLVIIPDKYQKETPDSKNPNITGQFLYNPYGTGSSETEMALGVRCIKDPLNRIYNYDFPTEYYKEDVEFTEGIRDPNSFHVVALPESSRNYKVVDIPVRKAFAVQSQILNNKNILSRSGFDDLRANIQWTDNPQLVKSLKINNPYPGSLVSLNDVKIEVTLENGQSGNAVISLHNRNVDNPAYWSWHVWVTPDEVQTVKYTTAQRDRNAENYINYVRNGDVIQSEFMDRNLGAELALTQEVTQERLTKSAGLHYQWGRKDPFPVFSHPDGSEDQVYKGYTGRDGYTDYEPVTQQDFENKGNGYIVESGRYDAGSSAPLAMRIESGLRYSVEHPFAFLVPQQLTPFAKTDTMGSDWLMSTPGYLRDRWGMGGEKGVFDPCPAGWRIPDLTAYASANDTSGKAEHMRYGRSPWSQGDRVVHKEWPISSFGAAEIQWNGKVVGYAFEDKQYKIGSFPIVGIRGYRSLFENATLKDIATNPNLTGIWTAGLFDSKARPISLHFDQNAKSLHAMFNDNDPYFGANCRCVRIEYDADHREEGVIPRLNIDDYSDLSSGTYGDDPNVRLVLGGTLSSQESDTAKTIVYPNPVASVLYIETKEQKDLDYVLFNMAGGIVKEGTFINKQLNMEGLTTGYYILKLKKTGKAFKILKK